MKLTWKQRLTGHIDELPSPAPMSTYVGSWNGMTHDQWQASNQHIAYARDLFTQPLFRDLLAVLTNSRPKPVTRGVTESEALVLLGCVQGYDLLLGLIQRLPSYPAELPEEVPATYGAEEVLDANLR